MLTRERVLGERGARGQPAQLYGLEQVIKDEPICLDVDRRLFVAGRAQPPALVDVPIVWACVSSSGDGEGNNNINASR